MIKVLSFFLILQPTFSADETFLSLIKINRVIYHQKKVYSFTSRMWPEEKSVMKKKTKKY